MTRHGEFDPRDPDRSRRAPEPDRRNPLPPQLPPPPGETPSITSWTRLEPSCRDIDMQHSVSARIYDPLWMLTRQWQTGEFQSEDVGSPVIARTRARTARLSRVRLGQLPADADTQGAPYKPGDLPLEVMVERRGSPGNSTQSKNLRFAVDAGLHFLRMLEQQPVSRNYRDDFIAVYPLTVVNDAAIADVETSRFLLTMSGRTVDARLLAEAFRTPTLDSRLSVEPADAAEIQVIGEKWLDWYERLLSQPGEDAEDAWIPDRLEYAVSVGGRLSSALTDDKTLTATEFYDGHLDWSDFDVDVQASLGTDNDDAAESLVQTTIPAPVSFRGTPAARFWEFEDARVEYGLLPVGPADLAQLLMIEYTSSYGNDWFVIPLELPVGSLTSIDSLVITDTFGVQTLLRPLGDNAIAPANWSMYQQAYLRRPGSDLHGVETNLFFLAPSLAGSLQSEPLEEVMFMRDEMANVAWAIEHSIESPLGRSFNRQSVVGPEAQVPTADTSTESIPLYVLASRVPANWIPLLPVQLTQADGSIISRLRRGAVLLPDGSQQRQHALGVLLNASNSLLLHDEEVPREGARLTRHYQMARWTNGSTFLWVANRKNVGRGEGSSGLRFDRLTGEP